jgi:hypothetical protein
MANGAPWGWYAQNQSDQSEIEKLKARIKELESENAQLRLDLFRCRKARKSKP